MGATKTLKLTNSSPGEDMERRDERGNVIVVQVLNVFTTTLPDSGANVRCADYRANGGREVYRMRADQDPDVWTLVDASTACGRRRRRAEWECCEGCCRRLGLVAGTVGLEARNGKPEWKTRRTCLYGGLRKRCMAQT